MNKVAAVSIFGYTSCYASVLRADPLYHIFFGCHLGESGTCCMFQMFVCWPYLAVSGDVLRLWTKTSPFLSLPVRGRSGTVIF